MGPSCFQCYKDCVTAFVRNTLVRCLKEVVSNTELVSIYHSLITSVFGLLPSKLLSKFERFQRRAHRLICDPSCDCEGFLPLSTKFEAAAVQSLFRAEASVHHPLHHLVPDRLPASNKFRFPVCVTNQRLNSFLPWAAELCNFSV